ncbi:hypothetical protein LO763_06705 [Glycomyces sp. A-F 0318]|uniref:hypothetical protein n=1 Tax=Glycomyces amatae TaxID=2881355 RepID=UPI001E5D17DF|nr:hypothetical protein [Glycomyces amatae]MCD0443315.1 hypothetical protein [Glycomyces amatae]
MESQLDPQAARAALDAVDQSRSDMADRLVAPWWYHPLLGVLVGGLVTVATADIPFQALLGVIAVYAAGLAALIAAYRRKARVWVGFWDGGPKTRRSAGLLFALLLVILVAGATVSMGAEITWTAPVTGLVVAVTMTLWGRRLDAIARAEAHGAS